MTSSSENTARSIDEEGILATAVKDGEDPNSEKETKTIDEPKLPKCLDFSKWTKNLKATQKKEEKKSTAEPALPQYLDFSKW